MESSDAGGRMKRFVRVAALAVLLLVVAPPLVSSASAATSGNQAEFCPDEARLYAAPTQLATMWPDVTSTPSAAQASSMVGTLFTMEYSQFTVWSFTAPTKKLQTQIYATGLAAEKQYEEAMFFNPNSNASQSAAAKARYTAIIKRSARTVKDFLASEASVLVGLCRHFNDTPMVEGIAVGTTNTAELIGRSLGATTTTSGLLRRAASEAQHYVVFVSLSGHGGAEKAHYRVATITGMVNACTNVPLTVPTTPVTVPC